MRISRWAFVLATVVAFATGCTGPGQVPQATSSPVSSPTTNPAGNAPTAATGSESEASTLLARAVSGLDQAKSFRFTIEAVHHWQAPGGQQYDWTFSGEGAAVPPSRFYSVMRGPADAMFEVKMIDGKITNVDTRGQRPEASTAFGGPGVGAAPYTVISYLKNSAAQGQAQAASLNGTETRRLTFAPSLTKVSAMDASHKGLQNKVQAIQGSVWVDAKTGRVSQETVTVQSQNDGLPQTVTITLKFTDYDAPVEIK